MSYKVLWTKNLSAEEKEKLQAKLKQAQDVLNRLDEILADKEKDAMKAAKPDMIDAGWPYVAADNNGYLRAIQEVRNIIPKE